MMEEELCPVQGSKWTLDDMNLEATAIKNSMIKCMNECAQKSKTVNGPYIVEWWTSTIEKLQSGLKIIRGYIRKWCYKRMNRDLPDFDSNKMKYTWEDLRKVRRETREAEVVVAANEAVKLYSLDALGNGRKNGGLE